MKVYIDYIFLINFIFDFIILLGINIILKRNASIYRIIIGSVVGAISIFILFIDLSTFSFITLKILFGFLMVFISFGYKDIKWILNNFLYLMILSVLIGGFLYMINIEVGYERVGMVFFKNGKSLNIFILILLAILILIIYIKRTKYQKKINYYYKVYLYINNEKYKLNGFLDTGNNLVDPYFNKPILILNKNLNINFNSCKTLLVPYKSLNNDGIMTCYFIKKIYIDKVGFKYNILLGITNDKITLSGVDIILNSSLLEEI